jgi:hypothetical protein
VGRDDVEQRRFGHAFLAERFQQHGRGIGAAARQCPGDAGDHSRAAGDQRFDEYREGFLVDEPSEHFDVGHRRDLVRVRQGGGDRFNRPGAELAQFCDGLLGCRSGDVRRGLELRDEPVGPDVGEKTHGTVDPQRA